jgi:hypothetical protein
MNIIIKNDTILCGFIFNAFVFSQAMGQNFATLSSNLNNI